MRLENNNPSLFSLTIYYLQKRDFLAAIQTGIKALEETPSHVDTWLNLASAYFNLAQFDKACDALEKGLKLSPKHVNMLVLASGAFAKRGEFGKAIECCQKVLALEKRHALASSHLAHCYNKVRDYEKAVASAKKALQIEPSSHSWLELGLAQLYLEQPEQALASFQKGLMLDPHLVDLLSNSAMALAYLGRTDEAVLMNQKALSLDPEHESALNNQAKMLCDLGRYEEGIDLFKKVLSKRPDHWEVVWNLSVVYLLLGRFEEGLDLYQQRLNVEDFHQHHQKLSSPSWQGEDLQVKTLLVRCEQGYGDSIQFLRYIPRLAKLGCQIAIEMPPELHGLFGHLGAELIGNSSEVPKHDFQVRLMSLMHLLPEKLSNIPPPVSLAQSFLCPQKNQIGLVWRGNPKHRKDRQRSLTLEQLKPLFQLKGLQFVCLQQKITEEERKFLEEKGVELHPLNSWQDTVSRLETCEKVICVDTSVAHLAASMGLATWILLPYVPDWRWQLERTDSPWYPSVQLFRQKELDRWDEPIQRIVEQVKIC